MPMCERCWADAFRMAMATGKSQPDCYLELLEERKDNPCSPEDQRGDFMKEADDER